MNSIKLKSRMDTIFMNSKNSKKTTTSEPHRLLLNLSDKLNLKKSDKHVALSNLSMYETRENTKTSYKKINLKYQLQRGMKILNYVMDHLL